MSKFKFDGWQDACHVEHDPCEDGMQDMRMLNSGSRGRLIHVFLAAWMIARTHVAVSCHLLAAFHFDLRHDRFRNTCEGRRSRPDQDQNERQDGTARRHNMMLHLQLAAVKGMCEQTGSSGIIGSALNLPQDPLILLGLCGAAGSRALPGFVLERGTIDQAPKRLASVESHFSQRTREMGHPMC